MTPPDQAGQTPNYPDKTEKQQIIVSDPRVEDPDNSPFELSASDDAGALELPPIPKTGGPGEQSRDPLWYQRAVFYEVLIRGFADSNGGRHGRYPWPHLKARLFAVARHRLPLAPADLPIAAARRWLRHQRFPEGSAGIRRSRRLRRASRGSSPAWHADHRRPGDEPHLRPAPLVFRRHAVIPMAPSVTSTCGRTPTTATPMLGSSSSTPRSPTGRGTRCVASTTGTGSSPISPT